MIVETIYQQDGEKMQRIFSQAFFLRFSLRSMPNLGFSGFSNEQNQYWQKFQGKSGVFTEKTIEIQTKFALEGLQLTFIRLIK